MANQFGIQPRSEADILAFNAGIFVIFGVMWPGLYYFLHNYVLTDQSAEFTRRCLSCFHWFVSFLISTSLYCEHFKESKLNKIYAALHDERAFGLLFTEDELKYEDVAIMNALIYILFDLSFHLYYKTETTLMLVNHSVLLTTATIYLFRDTMRMVFIEGYTLITVTEPLLHLRYFVKQNGKNIRIPEMIFISAFLIIRVCLLTYEGHKYITDENVDNVDKSLLLANYTTGLLFSINIAQYLQRKYEGKESGEILRGVGANPHPEQVVYDTRL